MTDFILRVVKNFAGELFSLANTSGPIHRECRVRLNFTPHSERHRLSDSWVAQPPPYRNDAPHPPTLRKSRSPFYRHYSRSIGAVPGIQGASPETPNAKESRVSPPHALDLVNDGGFNGEFLFPQIHLADRGGWSLAIEDPITFLLSPCPPSPFVWFSFYSWLVCQWSWTLPTSVESGPAAAAAATSKIFPDQIPRRSKDANAGA